ncbi:addiction module toxin RelE [Raoultella planticola]|uniref:Addiction module toxin RelE n=1 Tax=Raoultella planticola TaxID=575 RepID=A0A5P6ABH4_RAOPL|nr:addiction module toxin RelE [Raoultella planticola]PNK81756.1 addiction module toxin RelE [Raoultella planticola]QFG77161.1 addiction module toxin RelE [Raoultella planticola]
MYTTSFSLHQGGKCANPRALTPVSSRGEQAQTAQRQPCQVG